MAEQFLKNSKSDLADTSLTRLRSFDLREISKHNTKDDIWVVLNGRIYDITSMLPKHPGGEEIILNQIKKNQDVTETFYKMQHSADAIDFVKDACIGTVDREALRWGDLFSTKVEMLDYQHQNLINVMNDIYHNGIIDDLKKFIALWIIHCESEEYFMKTQHFSKDKQAAHIKDHERITEHLQKYYQELVQRYQDKLNPKQKEEKEDKDIDKEKDKEKKDTDKDKDKDDEKEEDKDKDKDAEKVQPFKCEELRNFIRLEMVGGFKTHAFEYDSLYVDNLGETDPSIGIKTTTNEMGLMQPIFPKIDDT